MALILNPPKAQLHVKQVVAKQIVAPFSMHRSAIFILFIES